MFGIVKKLAQREPAATAAVLSWIAGLAATLAGHEEFAPVLVAVGLAFLGVRAKVTPVVAAQETTQLASTQAALEVAKNLTDGTAGALGEVTGPATRIVDDALGTVSGLIGRKKT